MLRQLLFVFLCCLAPALPAVDHEPVLHFTLRQSVQPAGEGAKTQIIKDLLFCELPWRRGLPEARMPPRGYDRSIGQTTLEIDGHEIPVERWTLTRQEGTGPERGYRQLSIFRHPTLPFPGMLLGLHGQELYLPPHTLRVTTEALEQGIDFRGDYGGKTTIHYNDKPLPGHRFRYTTTVLTTQTTYLGAITYCPAVPGGVVAVEMQEPPRGDIPAILHTIAIQDHALLPEPAHLKPYPQGGFAYARPATFKEQPTTDGDYCHYANPQGIALRIGPAELGELNARDWLEAHPELVAHLPPPLKALTGFRGNLLNEPMFGWMEADGAMVAFARKGPRGYRIRIAGYDRLTPQALKQLSLGLRWLKR